MKIGKTILFCVGTIVLIILCIVKLNNKIANDVKLEAFFPNRNANLVEGELRTITYAADNETMIREAMDVLMNDGPKSKKLSRFEIGMMKIKSLELLDDGVVKMKFTNEYEKELSSLEKLFLKSGIVWTLTSFDFINNVVIENESMQLMNRNTVVINPSISSEKIDMRLVKLYFRKGNKLVAEERLVNMNPKQPVEKYILEQLILGPISNDLSATVPADTKVRDVKTDENICYVSLSDDFINKTPDDERFAIFSIVNSLTELENIIKVQFLIESEKTDKPQAFDLNKPFERNEKIIEQ